MENKNNNMKVYIFYREGMWYPLELKDDEDAIINAEMNPGTLKVEDHKGRQVWKAEQKPMNPEP